MKIQKDLSDSYKAHLKSYQNFFSHMLSKQTHLEIWLH